MKFRTPLPDAPEAVDFVSLPLAERNGYANVSRLPWTLRILLENQFRHGDDEGAHAIVDWLRDRRSDREIGFRPARVLMVDSSGIPLMADLAAMRDAMARLGGDPSRINPAVPVDLVIDHSVIADHWATPDALARNRAIEFERNHSRYAFLRWGEQSFANVRIIPPGSGICHQVNLEYLAQVVCTRDGIALPDSLVGMDSHTPMIGSLGIVGWGVGGLEGGTAALGEAVRLLVPEVTGVRLEGRLRPGVTTTDAVLSLTEALRRHRLVGRFVEFFGPGIETLTAQERGTLSNMTPEYGATMGFFPIDREVLRYLRLTGRTEPQIRLVESYARAQGLWHDAATPSPDYTDTVVFDLATVEPCVAGPGRPHQRVPLHNLPDAFTGAFPDAAPVAAVAGPHHGMVAIAAITSCTNTSNPSVMIAAGLLARNARRHGLTPKPWVKTTLSPGSRAVSAYLQHAGLLDDLSALGFTIAGFGCMTCMGNSGPLAPDVETAIDQQQLAAVAVLSGNRNFEGRVHPLAQANFLASPPLVVAFAIAGTIRIDLERDPIGVATDGRPVMLRDVWPTDAEVRETMERVLGPDLFRAQYADLAGAAPEWTALPAERSTTYQWPDDSTFIRRPPFFEDMLPTPTAPSDVHGARILGMFGDMLTTDHISPIGAIPASTPAGEYLASLGIPRNEFGSYASRRVNHDVMIRGTFANIHLPNELVPERKGGVTRHWPSGAVMTIFDAAQRYQAEGVPLVVIAGADYGAGSSRDWAAKGARLLGVRIVIAEGFERIHRSNLIGMGVLPLQFPAGVTRLTLGLRGDEALDVTGIAAATGPRATATLHVRRADGTTASVTLTSRLDTAAEFLYYCHGGILHYVVRDRLEGNRNEART